MVSEEKKIRPVGLRLAREKDFVLQDVSMRHNGLPAQRIDRRSSRFGNPFRIGAQVDLATARCWGWEMRERRRVCQTAQEAVYWFGHCLLWDEAIHEFVRHELGGKNLACWCALDEPCHRVPLLFVANSTPAEIQRIHSIIERRLLTQAEALELFEEDRF